MRKEIKNFRARIEEAGSYVVFDTETTGLKPSECDVIEFSAVKADKDGNIIDEIDVYINPGYPLPEKITEITGITDDELSAKGIGVDEAVAKIKAFMGDFPVIAGYNVNFDIGFVSEMYNKAGEAFSYTTAFDVLKLARVMLPKPHKLINVCETLSLTGYQFHRSIDDAKATHVVLLTLLKDYPEDSKGDSLEVTGCSRWKKYSYDRIYINNKNNASIYLDVNTMEWNIGGDFDEEDVSSKVCLFMGVKDKYELASAV